jgi:hypothetical protein
MTIGGGNVKLLVSIRGIEIFYLPRILDSLKLGPGRETGRRRKRSDGGQAGKPCRVSFGCLAGGRGAGCAEALGATCDDASK